MSAIDPIDKLVASGISVRTLVSHFLISVEWLAAHSDATFRLCYHDDDGAVQVDTVKGAAALMRRAKELGWTPNSAEPTEKGAPELFDEAIHHVRRGVHWFASATDNTFGMLPLAWPAAVLRRAQEREDRERAKFLREKEAKEKRDAASKKAANRAIHAGIIDRAAHRLMDSHAQAGKPISYNTARRTVLKNINEAAAQVNALAESMSGKIGSAK
ncbi:hypothetical protein ACM9XA_11435 [Xanthomonas sacchari]